MKTHLDLFSGIGGFAIAAQACGYTTIGFCEKEKYAQAVLRKHWPDVPICDDIFQLTPSVIASMMDLCNRDASTYARDVRRDSQRPSAPTASHATPSSKRNGETRIESEQEQVTTHGLKVSDVKSSPTTEESVRAVENLITSFLPSTTSSTMETPSGRNTKVQHGSSQSAGDFQTTTPSFVTTATKQKHTSEYVHTRRISLLTAGFPCQPFSVAGKRAGENDDRHLWPQIVRLLQELSTTGEQPDFLLLENVAGIVTMELDNILSDLESLGYAAWPLVIPACAVDARHRRDRVWIVAHADKPGSQGCWRESSGLADSPERTRPEGQTGICGEDVAHARSGGREGQVQPLNAVHPAAAGDGQAAQSFDGGRPAQWLPEPELGRVANGIPNRAHRLRGLGNAIVPQVACEIIRAIVACSQ